MNGIIRIAIACQGGGSHTAFTAGVLKRILEEKYEIVGLSGTSGGAICALLAWYGLLTNDRSKAIELLDSFWKDNSTRSPWEMFLNNWLLWLSRLRDVFTVPEVSPYFYPPSAQEYLKSLIEKHVEFEEVRSLVRPSSPMLLIGAIDACSGKFKVFSSKDGEISADAILASAAIPNLFRAVHIGGSVYWDGLFSQNPPVRDLPDVNPDEIWVIQINPERREAEPKSVGEILDRRNELAGNLSLSQELFFIEKINELVNKKFLAGSKYKYIKVRRIEMIHDLDYASKLDRSPSFIQDLIDHGEAQAEEFLNQLHLSD
ncbi:MAG TPA: patatin-like phospholipase family protein [Thermodesulfobacteriota bacterium]|nr:patatin-like phospholipase family protein [Thermodesulfobacteriota bacterium]